jgi:hypothetical protein
MCDQGSTTPSAQMLPHGSGATMTGKGQHTQGAHTPSTGKGAPFPPPRPASFPPPRKP